MSNASRPEPAGSSDIAIVGLAARFPGARNLEEIWNNLRDGVESVSVFSPQELAKSLVPTSWISHPRYVPVRAILENPESFDAAFFAMSAREAEITDPQQRVFLECAWEALENAGYSPESYQRPIGVYAGTSINSYMFMLFSNMHQIKMVSDLQMVIGNDKDHLATRVSYKLNLKGPSVNVQSACSTSLVAVHLACQSLLNGECDMAIAGGVSVLVPQKTGYFYFEGGISSPDGHCRPFDAQAKGTINGNGAAVLLLKRLPDALADGDCIRAVIKGSAINNDGSSKVGYTAPSIEGQARAVAEAQDMAGVEPESITYIEAHGTGTALGDPVEIAALTQAFGEASSKKGFCAIGSLKSNIGHLDAAAGAAGLIKTVLALEHKMIPPSINFEGPNPKIDFSNTPFYVNTKLADWDTGKEPRRAGVSSFGIGGTNAHVILEQAPDVQCSGPSRSRLLLILSARTATALEEQTRRLAAHLNEKADLNLADIAYTLQLGRATFAHKRFVVCSDSSDAVAKLEARDPARVFTGVSDARERPVTFMFPGQGTQYANMGRELYDNELGFREEVDRCAEILVPHLGTDLRTVLWGSAVADIPEGERLNQTAITQPALFVVEYALARMWMKWGINPRAMIGHSVGEYVAACLAGVLSLKDGLALVATRGRLMQKMPRGAMLAVALAEEQLRPLLGDQICVAAVNGPSMCVISGPIVRIEEHERELGKGGVACWRLDTSHAYHSAMMEPGVKPFAARVREVKLNPPEIPFISNVTGSWISESEAMDPDYWAGHLRQTVRFSDGLANLLKEPDGIFLEVGPGRSLSRLVKDHPNKLDSHVVISSLRRAKETTSDQAVALESLGKLWLAGTAIDWAGLYSTERRLRVQLPTYPFERQLYLIGSSRALQPTVESADNSLERADGREDEDHSIVPVTAMGGSSEPLPQPSAVDLSQVELSRFSGDSAVLGEAHRILMVDGHLETADPDVGRIVEIQLGIMSKQLELLRDQDSTDVGPHAPIAAGIH